MSYSLIISLIIKSVKCKIEGTYSFLKTVKVNKVKKIYKRNKLYFIKLMCIAI